jgi:beta propeller repeat protein
VFKAEIYGNRIVWVDDRDKNSSIYMFTLDTSDN